MEEQDHDPRMDETGGSEEMPISLRTQTVPGTTRVIESLEPAADGHYYGDTPPDFTGLTDSEIITAREGESLGEYLSRLEKAEGTQVFKSGSKRAKMPPVRFDLLPPAAVERLARTYDEGAKKYGDWNWRKGQPYSSVINHLLAHIFQFMARKDQSPLDEDHLAHAAWGLLALMQFEAGPEKFILDDRYGCPGWVSPDIECDRGEFSCDFHRENPNG